MTFPEIDELGKPLSKMPNCPRCDEDELGVINPALMICYRCDFELRREFPWVCAKCGQSKTHLRLKGYQCPTCD